MSQVILLCEKILAHVTNLGSTIAGFMQPGISMSQIEDKESDMPFKFPESLMDVYSWHNGTFPGTELMLFPRSYFSSFERSVDAYFMCHECFHTEEFWKYEVTGSRSSAAGSAPKGELDYIWNYRWFPIFPESLSISTFGIVCGDDRIRDGEIVYYAHLIDTRRAFLGLETMLATILEWYNQSLIYMDSDGDLEWDYQKCINVALQLNPGSDFWEEQQHIIQNRNPESG